MTMNTLENPVTGERFDFTEVGDERLAFDLTLREGGKVPIPHVHPVQTERFTVTRGRVKFRLGVRTVLASPGDIVEVPPGMSHAFANAGAGEAHMRVEVTPALAMEAMLREVVAMAQAGRMNRRGLPRNLFELAALARRYDNEAHAPMPRRLQRILLAPLVRNAKRGSSRPWLTPTRSSASSPTT